jgi:uncharacterized Zn finger protein
MNNIKEKCPNCGYYMNDISNDSYFTLECQNCLLIRTEKIVLFGKK